MTQTQTQTQTRKRYPWKKWSDGEWHDTGIGRDPRAESRLRGAANVYGWRNGYVVEFDVDITPYHELTEEEQAVARFEGLPRVLKIRLRPKPGGPSVRKNKGGRGRKTSSYDQFIDAGLFVASFDDRDERMKFRRRIGAWAWQRGLLVTGKSYTVQDAGWGQIGQPFALRFQVRSSEDEPLSPLLHSTPSRDIDLSTNKCRRCGVRTDESRTSLPPAEKDMALKACDGCGRLPS